eukprot:GEMP01059098.1.p1 GENE.GEMP01059098.1~~GEMP01059098.1.p1  ORF type:complete len:312 (+),score=62.24 GEMP01059098.1:34-936(+)
MAVPTIETYYKNDQEVVEPYTLRSFLLDISDKVATVTWNNPKQLNTLNEESTYEMFFLIEYLARRKDVHAVIWTGAGKAFCAGMSAKVEEGNNIKEDIRKGYKHFGKGEQVPEGLAVDIALKGLVIGQLKFPKVSIAAVNGVCVGAGVNIALLLHDFSLVAKSARFRYPFTELGFTPELSSSYMLPRAVGMAKAKELLYLGEWFNADDALQMRLCTRVVEDSALMAEAKKLALHLASLNQTALRLAKEVINKPMLDVLEAGGQMDVECRNLQTAMMSEETQKTFKAFQARHGKKKPRAAL